MTRAAPEGLLTRAEALRAHAGRLRAVAEGLTWSGPEADALRADVTRLALRCAAAADALAAAARSPRPPARRRGLLRGLRCR
ncbi:hypothetical protein [Streptomyces sp. CC228A]|uniref:hypothetical protein n=1 Tax=Streptomyces sp. CC228A TaxID=2898186 RepID=UPI001F2E8E05|nr:hypothetical protein [Streptomyces sp. CC228A]